MPANVFLNFLFLLIYRHGSKHIAVFLISTLVVMLFSSVMLLSHAVEEDIKVSLAAQPDFIGEVPGTPAISSAVISTRRIQTTLLL